MTESDGSVKSYWRLPRGLVITLALAFTALISGGLVNRYYETHVSDLEVRLEAASDSLVAARHQGRQNRMKLERDISWLELEIRQLKSREIAPGDLLDTTTARADTENP